MCDGIDASALVIVFVTERYVAKVAGDNAADNCQKEFNYADLQKTNAKMIAAVMEPRMKDTKKWVGAVGMALGGQLYHALDSDETFDRDVEALYQAIVSKLEFMMPGVALAPPAPSVAAAAQEQQRQRENEQARSAAPPSHPRSPQKTLLFKLHRAHTNWDTGSIFCSHLCTRDIIPCTRDLLRDMRFNGASILRTPCVCLP